VISKIDHVGIAVASIDAALELYRLLGLEVEAIEEVQSEGVRVALLPCGDSRIELLEPTRESSPIARFLDRRGPGIHHLCLATDAVEGDSDRLRAAGIQLLRERPTRGAGGCYVQFVHPRSAGGVLVELSERRPPEAGPTSG